MIKDKLVVTPQRLQALVACVHATPRVPRDTLMGLLQPPAITDNQDTAKILYRYARRYQLVREEEGGEHAVSLTVPPAIALDADAFRRYMQGVLLGVTDESQDNFLLSQFTAWYAVQDERVMGFSKANLEAKFHEDLYPSSSQRVLAEEPGISSWRTWAEFLGWGWPLKFSQTDEAKIVPDATLRIRPNLPDLLPDASVEVPFGNFIARLGDMCPELDGGILYSQCWEASRDSEARGNRVSLMVSTALRVLHEEKALTLLERRDFPDNWSLFPAQSHINRVTHVRREKAR